MEKSRKQRTLHHPVVFLGSQIRGGHKFLSASQAKLHRKMQGFQSLMMPKSLIAQRVNQPQAKSGIVATSADKKYDLTYYVKGALAGGICCAITHGGLW